MSREAIQHTHEVVVIEEFAKFFKNNGQIVEVLHHPQIPHMGDGILLINQHKQWVEIVDVYLNKKEAKDLWQSITPGEKAEPKSLSFKDSIRPREFHKVLVSEIKKKLENKGYQDSLKIWGAGMLICVCRDPLVDFDCEIEREFVYSEFTGENLIQLRKLNDKVFKETYLFVHASGQRKFFILCSFS